MDPNILALCLGLLFIPLAVQSEVMKDTPDSEKRLHDVLALIEKGAEMSEVPAGGAANKDTDAHKNMRAVLTQWQGFIDAMKAKPEKPAANVRSITGAKQTRWINGGNNNNNVNNNNNNNDNMADTLSDNHYYSGQGYYSRTGSAGTKLKKPTDPTTTTTVSWQKTSRMTTPLPDGDSSADLEKPVY